MSDAPPQYVIYDNHAKCVVSKPYTGSKGFRRANTRRDKLDLEYGAIRYSVRPL